MADNDERITDERITNEITSLNLDDLDVEELEKRLEMATASPQFAWACDADCDCPQLSSCQTNCL